MTLPLYGFVQGDTLGLVVLAQEDETVLQLVERMLRSSSLRVAPFQDPVAIYEGRRLDPRLRVSQVGFRPLSRLDVRPGSDA